MSADEKKLHDALGDEDDDVSDAEVEHLVKLTGSDVVAPEMIGAAEAEAVEVRARLHELRDIMADTYFEIGRLLYRVKRTAMWKRWTTWDKDEGRERAYKDFGEFIKTELKISQRTGVYYAHIWWWFSGLPNHVEIRDDLREIGWAKAKLLVGLADKDTIHDWLTRAKNLTLDELEQETKVAMEAAGLKKRPGTRISGTSPAVSDDRTGIAPVSGETKEGGSDYKPPHVGEKDPYQGPPDLTNYASSKDHPADDKTARPKGVKTPSAELLEDFLYDWTVKLSKEQREFVEEAIALAQTNGGLDNDVKGKALEYISMHFTSFCGGISGPKEYRKKAFAREVLDAIVRNYGIELVAVIKGTNKVVFGQHVVGRMEEWDCESPEW